jgi:hypothetical protein
MVVNLTKLSRYQHLNVVFPPAHDNATLAYNNPTFKSSISMFAILQCCQSSISMFYLLAILFLRSLLNVSITPSGAGQINASSLVLLRFWHFSAGLVAVSSACMFIEHICYLFFYSWIVLLPILLALECFSPLEAADTSVDDYVHPDLLQGCQSPDAEPSVGQHGPQYSDPLGSHSLIGTAY